MTTRNQRPAANDAGDIPLATRFAPFARKMQAAGLDPLVIETFRYYYAQLAAGQTGYIRESAIRPVEMLPDADALPAALEAVGQTVMQNTVVIKLNGGLGTSMGLEKAKSLLVVREGLTFLDIIARQAQRSGAHLVFMNSYNTEQDTLEALRPYADLWRGRPATFGQNKTPKVARADLSPAEWPADPTLEWCPPGHGDIYTALVTSGMLARLLEDGFRYAFVSNADNLGAVLDPRLLGYFVNHRLPFMMEVAMRTAADRKGGHLAKRGDGQLILRESAQCLPEDETAFQDIGRHRYFNTNNLWLDLSALKQKLAARRNVLGLPMIRNTKTIDPRNRTSPQVYQLETAMGAAVGVFEGAGAIRVPRTRFAPVKTTGDLLGVRSDAFILSDDFRILPNPERRQSEPPVIDLDPQFYSMIDDLEARLTGGPPSLLDCTGLVMRGDIRFGRDIRLSGKVRLSNPGSQPMILADGMLIEGAC